MEVHLSHDALIYCVICTLARTSLGAPCLRELLSLIFQLDRVDLKLPAI